MQLSPEPATRLSLRNKRAFTSRGAAAKSVSVRRRLAASDEAGVSLSRPPISVPSSSSRWPSTYDPRSRDFSTPRVELEYEWRPGKKQWGIRRQVCKAIAAARAHGTHCTFACTTLLERRCNLDSSHAGD